MVTKVTSLGSRVVSTVFHSEIGPQHGGPGAIDKKRASNCYYRILPRLEDQDIIIF